MTEDNRNNPEEKLRSIVELIDVSNALTKPLTNSIENLLHLTAAEMKSEEASVLIRDGDFGDLRFLTAIGRVAEHLIDLKVPAGKGIAGFVFSSGQPISVADVGEDESFYAEVDRQTGYSTNTILATPLRHNGEIIGVLEYVNRTSDSPTPSFTAQEMDKASLYAEVIASLVNSYESANILRDLTERILFSNENIEAANLRGWLEELRSGADHREMLNLAILVREIAVRGEAERRMCCEILESILRYSEARNETSFLSL